MERALTRVLAVLLLAAAAVGCDARQRAVPPEKTSEAESALPASAQANGSRIAEAPGLFAFRRGEPGLYRRAVSVPMSRVIENGADAVATSARQAEQIGPGDASIGLLALAATGIFKGRDKFDDVVLRLERARNEAVATESVPPIELPLVLISLIDDYGLSGRVMSKAGAVRCVARLCDPAWLAAVRSAASDHDLARLEAWGALAALEWRLSGLSGADDEAWDDRLAQLVRNLRASRSGSESPIDRVLRSAASALLLPPGTTHAPAFDLSLAAGDADPPQSSEEIFLIRTAAAWVGTELGTPRVPPEWTGGRTARQLSVRADAFELLILATPMRLGVR